MIQARDPRSHRDPGPMAEGGRARRHGRHAGPQLQGTGQWIATSGSDATVAYELRVTGNVAHGCDCLAGLNGDPVCKHRAAFYLLIGAGHPSSAMGARSMTRVDRQVKTTLARLPLANASITRAPPPPLHASERPTTMAAHAPRWPAAMLGAATTTACASPAVGRAAATWIAGQGAHPWQPAPHTRSIVASRWGVGWRPRPAFPGRGRRCCAGR